MSYVNSIKKLLADDLKSLIIHISKEEADSPQFKKYEDLAWSHILDRYYPSVNDDKVKSSLNDFVDKFKVHGFPQKARNLKALIDAYSNLNYFKKFSGAEIQWGLVDLLIKVSYKPTSSLEDDSPLDLPKESAEAEDSFDWTSYLKEGLEKFRLPSDEEGEESLSSWSEVESPVEEEGPQNSPYHEARVRQPAPGPSTSAPGEEHPRQTALMAAQTASDWLRLNTHNFWWNNPTLREIPPSNTLEANYYFLWEQNIGNKKKVDNVRVLSEYKVLNELVHLLFKPSHGYFIEEDSEGNFIPKRNVSICSLSHVMFSTVIEVEFCRYLRFIKKLDNFCLEMESVDIFTARVPSTYKRYCHFIRRFLSQYRKIICEIEARIVSQEDVSTLHVLVTNISPWLDRIEFMYHLHMSAIFPDWKEQQPYKCAFRLVNVVYEQLRGPLLWKVGDFSWPKTFLLGLFVECLSPFMLILGKYMMGDLNPDPSEEFLLDSHGRPKVESEPGGAEEFWKPVLETASRAVTSSNFLVKLGRDSHFFLSNHNPEKLHNEFVQSLRKSLNLPNFRGSLEEGFNCEDQSDFSLQNQSSQSQSVLYYRTPTEYLMEDLKGTDLSTSLVHLQLGRIARAVIETYMEPNGFAADILLNNIKLLEHFNALYVALQVTAVLSTILIRELGNVKNFKKKIQWSELLRKCLFDVLPQEYAQNFRLILDPRISLLKDARLKDVSDFLHLRYQTNEEIGLIIKQDTILNYTLIFRFLLKFRISLATLNSLPLKDIEETDNNSSRLRRLYSMRMWLIHTMSSLNSYFSSYSNNEFEKEFSEICSKERNLIPILKAHNDFLENWKEHCFLTKDHPCAKHVFEILSMGHELKLLWTMEENGFLADYHLSDIEGSYSNSVRQLALNLQLFENKLSERNNTFSLLYDEIVYNIPERN